MANNTVIIGKPSSGKTTTFEAIKINIEQLEQSYRHITVEYINESKAKAIGSLTNKN